MIQYFINQICKITFFSILSILFLMSVAGTAFAQNPIVPPGVYLADPSAHQWPDGKMYVYGSRDESLQYYCSWNYDVLSSADLKTWKLTPKTFVSKGAGDQVAYSDELLYAPDCLYHKGIYYLYYCLADGTHTEGVATSASPAGPFTNGENIDLGANDQIDPCVFKDDDGKVYYIWGQFNAKIARLKPDMHSIDSATIKDNLVTQKEHFFHEGGYMVKRNGIYYFIYAHMGRAGRPTCLGYATAKSPFGPFKYGGVIIDNDHCDPAVWNNHGSIAQFNGKWYVFYHRSTHGSNVMRKACVEPITFNKDGSIPEVEMTTQGAAGPLSAFDKMDAERACLLYGNVRIKDCDPDNEDLESIKQGDMAAYKYLDFENGANKLIVRAAPGAKPVTIEIKLDDSWSSTVGTVKIPGNGDGKTWQLFETGAIIPKGVHALWLSFNGAGEDIVKLDWFKFGR
jgi:arabinoxylan arabinofuranohydrolase